MSKVKQLAVSYLSVESVWMIKGWQFHSCLCFKSHDCVRSQVLGCAECNFYHGCIPDCLLTLWYAHNATNVVAHVGLQEQKCSRLTAGSA